MNDIFPDLLSTKLALPRPRHFLIPRDTLFSLLDTGLDHAVTLLTAPAGFGKTTVVRAWIAARNAQRLQFKASWLALDTADNDPVRFWRYILAACQHFDTSIGQRSLQWLNTQPPLQADYALQYAFEAMLTPLINDLSQLTEPCVLVLEDYHVIALPQIHEVFAYFLDHLPDPVHVLLLSRNDLPLPLAHLRGQGSVLEIRSTDLRFSRQEVRTFLQQVHPLPLSNELLELIYERTEGWGAGLNLLALALRRYADDAERQQFVATLTGRYRPLLEYLVNDVLNTQTQLLQTFLLQTSGLPRLTGSLCNTVTQRNDSEVLLEQLERANLFLDQLDGAGQWYRYHPLFAEAMQHEAHHRLPVGDYEACFQRASAWYEQQHMLSEAIEAALKATDFLHAARLIHDHCNPIYQKGSKEIFTLRRWFEQIPLEQLEPYPVLYMLYATALAFDPSGRIVTDPAQIAPIERLLSRAEQHYRASQNSEDSVQIGAIYALRALLAAWQEDFRTAGSFARQALSFLGNRDKEIVEWRSACLSLIGAEEQSFGSLTTALELVQESFTVNQAASVNPYGRRAIKLALAGLFIELGELHLAGEHYRQVLYEAEADLFDRGKALLGLSLLAYQWNDLENAAKQAQDALEIAQRLHDEKLQGQAELALARIFYVLGEAEEAENRLQALINRLQGYASQLLLRECLFWRARLHLQSENLDAVLQWIHQRPSSTTATPLWLLLQEDMLIARWLLKSGDSQQAQCLLEQCLDKAIQHAHKAASKEIELLQALTYFQQNNLSKAVQLTQGLTPWVRAQGYQRIFLDEGKELAALLQACAGKQHIEHPHASTLQPAFTEELSQQEQRVLRLFVAGLTKAEIASELIISTNTVKTHLQRIYHKLHVSSRTEARETVQRLHLL